MKKKNLERSNFESATHMRIFVNLLDEAHDVVVVKLLFRYVHTFNISVIHILMCVCYKSTLTFLCIYF